MQSQIDLTSIYRAPVAVKARATPGDAPGLTRVTPDQEGLGDNPGGYNVATIAPPQAPPGRPGAWRSDPGAPWDEKTHWSVSTATPGSPRLPRGDPGRL